MEAPSFVPILHFLFNNRPSTSPKSPISLEIFANECQNSALLQATCHFSTPHQSVRGEKSAKIMSSCHLTLMPVHLLHIFHPTSRGGGSLPSWPLSLPCPQKCLCQKSLTRPKTLPLPLESLYTAEHLDHPTGHVLA